MNHEKTRIYAVFIESAESTIPVFLFHYKLLFLFLFTYRSTAKTSVWMIICCGVLCYSLKKPLQFLQRLLIILFLFLSGQFVCLIVYQLVVKTVQKQ